VRDKRGRRPVRLELGDGPATESRTKISLERFSVASETEQVLEAFGDRRLAEAEAFARQAMGDFLRPDFGVLFALAIISALGRAGFLRPLEDILEMERGRRKKQGVGAD
jgi:hypothetical protein